MEATRVLSLYAHLLVRQFFWTDCCHSLGRQLAFLCATVAAHVDLGAERQERWVPDFPRRLSIPI